jgi:hypothetical protein
MAALGTIAIISAAVAAAQARRVLRQVYPDPERVVQAVHQVSAARPLPMLAAAGVVTTTGRAEVRQAGRVALAAAVLVAPMVVPE